MIGAASDGAVYVCNLTTESVGTNLRIYRWANDSAATVPTLAYSGNPSGYSQRFGDTMDVRGSGTGTQILMASRLGTNVLVFTTANGSTFAPTVVNVAGVPVGAFGLGISFGAGNTFWGKASSQPLRKVGFDLAAGTGQVLQANGAPTVVDSVAPIGVATNLNVCVGISIETPDNLQLYDLKDNGSVVLVETNAFATDNPNSNATGAVDFGGDRAFALDSGNGILAVRILPPSVPPEITAHPQSQTVKAWGEASLAVSATGTPVPAYQWRREGTDIAGATTPLLALADVQATDAGAYSVVVSNTAGSVASQEAVLTVLAIVPPQITNLAVASGATHLGGLGDPGQFVIEVSTNLFQWSAAATLPSADGRFLWTDSETNSARFYRARWIP
jgi:hypothetical protein